MAQVLVRADSAPVEDGPGKHYAGFVAVVMPDDHVWGRLEGPPTFVVIRLPNVSLEKARELLLAFEEGVTRRTARVPPGVITAILAVGGTTTIETVTDQSIDQWVEKRTRQGGWR